MIAAVAERVRPAVPADAELVPLAETLEARLAGGSFAEPTPTADQAHFAVAEAHPRVELTARRSAARPLSTTSRVADFPGSRRYPLAGSAACGPSPRPVRHGGGRAVARPEEVRKIREPRRSTPLRTG
ncbi:MAG TPA: hypothetical protein VG317_21010 [Pseudonocardiaceae bacterium]|nr:hypothetical protein [Pseudonocardiaceae bacterium]